MDLEAIAKGIWGDGVMVITPRPDDGVDVDTITDTDVSLSRYHRLDKHGRVACHVSCQEKQDRQ